MLGLYAPPGADERTVRALERFADYTPGGSEMALAALADAQTVAREILRDCFVPIDGLSAATIDTILANVHEAIGALSRDYADDDSHVAYALQSFIRDELVVVPPARGGHMTTEEFAAARADNAANAHRRKGAATPQQAARAAPRRAKRA